MQRRVSTPDGVAYLQSNHPEFGPALKSYPNRVREVASKLSPLQTKGLFAKVAYATDCINIAGLCDSDKRNWYPADLADVVRSASKLGYTPDEMRTIIENADWAQGCPVCLTSEKQMRRSQ